ncbi:primary-amine oxidase [Microbacterium sp.]|uniref:primary-amine oxidase n=1 Tax=Microbacterium sp. TaxID=51671 RepID=UPI003C72BE64
MQSATKIIGHPLDPLSMAEIDAFRETVEAAGLAGPSARYGYVVLREPEKASVLAFRTGDDVTREVGALVMDVAANTLTDVLVDVVSRRVIHSRELDPRTDGWGPALDEDFVRPDAILKADPEWVAALARRGITDLDRVCTVPLSAGVYGYEDEAGVRVVRVLAFWQEHPSDLMWAHPIDGVVAHVDLSTGKVLRVVETDHRDVPRESGDYTDPALRGPERTDLRPIVITQPEGVSFQIDGNLLTWQNWSVRIGFNGREGLTLHQLAFRDGDRVRPIMYRGSVSEMVVPYGEPGPTHGWQNYFDVGEYQFGRLANTLELGCDCLGEITYLDATVVDDLGTPRTIKNAICIHEEDYGILWKHTDSFAGTHETRRQRRLVVSFFVTVGNYDYGFYWYLYLDGTIQLEGKATGIVFTSGVSGNDDPHASQLAPGLGAPFHQHLFCARLDMTVDGVANNVDEVDAVRMPVSPDNPWGNALTRRATRLTSEARAQRLASPGTGRVWRVSNAETKNRLGEAPSYVLYPEGQPVLMAADGSSAQRRADFATKHLWVTSYDRDELWAAGRIVNQHPGGAGLPAYAAGDRSLEDADVVLWHTFGLTHFPRTEDWPIMPVDYAGFTMKPHGFFDRNPTLDVPASTMSHAHRGETGSAHDGSCCAHH